MKDLLMFPVTSELVEVILGKVIQAFMEKKKATLRTSKTIDKIITDKHIISPVFGKFVTRNKDFSNHLINIKDIVQIYAEKRFASRPLNILLASAPGSGKSFLIKQLASSISRTKVNFDEFYVTAFQSIDDLLGVFQRVQSANLKGELPFILFDEVDGKVGDRHILSNLLAPMWDGVFHTGKESFLLGKAIFLFAASSMVPPPIFEEVYKGNYPESITYFEFAEKWQEVALKKIEDSSNKLDKCEDFIDRIDIMLCIPSIHKALLGDDVVNELLDLAIMIVKKHFPNVLRIEKSAALVLINYLTTTSSRRRAEKCIFSTAISKEDEFHFSDLPSIEKVNFGKINYIKDQMKQFIEIEIR